MGTESLRTYKKIEPSSYSMKDRIVQIIGFSGLLLWSVVYAIKTINFNEYEDGLLIDDSSLIKAILFLASISFTASIFLGTWTYYKIKRTYSNNLSTGVMNAAKWVFIGFFILMTLIPLIFPESDRFHAIYLTALLYAGKHIMDKMLKKLANECERTCM